MRKSIFLLIMMTFQANSNELILYECTDKSGNKIIVLDNLHKSKKIKLKDNKKKDEFYNCIEKNQKKDKINYSREKQ